MQLAGVACCGHFDKAFLFIVRGQKPLTRTERERESCNKLLLPLLQDRNEVRSTLDIDDHIISLSRIRFRRSQL